VRKLYNLRVTLLTFCSLFAINVSRARFIFSSSATAQNTNSWLWVKVLHATRHKIGHFTDVLPSQSLGSVLNNTTTITVLWPFVRDYPGEPVPEETLTHPPSWSSSNLHQLLPSTTIPSIIPVQITCLAVFLHNLSTEETKPNKTTANVMQTSNVDAKCDKLATELRWQHFAFKVANLQLPHLHLTYPTSIWCLHTG